MSVYFKTVDYSIRTSVNSVVESTRDVTKSSYFQAGYDKDDYDIPSPVHQADDTVPEIDPLLKFEKSGSDVDTLSFTFSNIVTILL